MGSARGLTLGLDLGLDLNGVGSVHGQLGERLDGEVGTLGAGLDEGSGEGEDGAGTESGIKGLGDGDLAAKDTDGGLMSGFDGENGAGNAQNGGVLEERSGAQVGGDTDVLEDGGGLDHGGGVGEAKLVLAGLDGLDAVLGERGLQERDVLGLGLANLLEVGNLDVVEAEGLEVGVGELGETLTVEGLLEVFQGQGTVRDVSGLARNREIVKLNLQLKDIQVSESGVGIGLLGTLSQSVIPLLTGSQTDTRRNRRSNTHEGEEGDVSNRRRHF